MKSAAGNVMAILAGLAVPAYAGTSFVSKWAAKDAQAGSFQGKKVIAGFMSTDEALRRGVEDTLAYELTKRGVQGVPAYSVVPRSEIQDEEKAKARVIGSGAAGAVVLRLVGTQQEFSASSAQYFTPMYSGMWGGYWG